MDARFREGTIARIDAVLEDKEARTDLIAVAVDRELDRRERRGAAAVSSPRATKTPAKK
jgi:hypothetical protein